MMVSGPERTQRVASEIGQGNEAVFVALTAADVDPPGLSIDVADDRSVIYVHSMFIGDPEEFRRTIKNEFERRVLELLR